MQDNGFRCEPLKEDEIIENLVKNDEYILRQVKNLSQEVERLKNKGILQRLKNLLKIGNLWIQK